FIDGAKPLIRTAAKTLGKAAVSFALRQSANDIAEGYDKEVEALAGASIDASIDLIIRDKINAEKNLDTLHRALEEVTKEKELVLLIDELDRCRATFAIDLLETIKHAFSTSKVIILIIANSAQLETSFRHRYGSNNDTKNYLE
ncbi:P-loop NTPase fold protein, partial [Escherichia coli]|uniref:P-loop NTPase fold protein n=1 Tax=Escherichia coli TaxID=562 RepID=UPI003FA5EA8C